MVAYTPNRTYPYSTATDPADVPAAIQALAEAVDDDMVALYSEVTQRPAAMVSKASGNAQNFPDNVLTECEFDFVDIDTAAISDLTVQPTRLTPTSAGFWIVSGAVEMPQAAFVFDVYLRQNGNDLVRYSQPATDPGSSAGAMMTLSHGCYMNGTTDYFTMTVQPRHAFDQFTTDNFRMSCVRITAS